MHEIEGSGNRQSPRQSGASEARGSASRSGSALLSVREAAALLGVGERRFHQLRVEADWLPPPLVLGPRCLRWDRDELIAAARTRAPRQAQRVEPKSLLRARIERAKATGDLGSRE